MVLHLFAFIEHVNS